MPRPRGFVAVPLLRAGAPIGAIVLARNTPGEFSATQVELLRTFAEQAVIAISSAETFKELQRRTADLTRSVAELQALEEVLRAVNSSLELETVLSTIISRAVQLSDADEGTIYEYDVSEQVFVPKSAFGMSAERVAALRERRIKLGNSSRPQCNTACTRVCRGRAAGPLTPECGRRAAGHTRRTRCAAASQRHGDRRAGDP